MVYQKCPSSTRCWLEDWRAIGINAEVFPVEWPSVQPLFMARPQLFDEFAPAPVLHGAQPARPGGDVNAVRRNMSGADTAMLTYFAPDVADAMLGQLTGLLTTMSVSLCFRH